MKVQFPYNPILIDEIKSIPGRSWDPADKSWSFPDEYLGLAIQTIAPHYPEIAASLNEYALKEESTSPALLDISNAASVSDLTSFEANAMVEERWLQTLWGLAKLLRLWHGSLYTQNADL